MRVLVLITVAVMGFSEASAQVSRPTGSKVVAGGAGAIEGTGYGLGYHANLRQRLLTDPTRALGIPTPDVSVSAEAFYQRGLAENGSPWLLGAGLVSRWDPDFVESWAVRPFFIPVSVGLYVDGGAYTDEAAVAVGIGNGLGVEVPVGDAAVALEVRTVNLLGSERGGGIPVGIGVRF